MRIKMRTVVISGMYFLMCMLTGEAAGNRLKGAISKGKKSIILNAILALFSVASAYFVGNTVGAYLAEKELEEDWDLKEEERCS